MLDYDRWESDFPGNLKDFLENPQLIDFEMLMCFLQQLIINEKNEPIKKKSHDFCIIVLNYFYGIDAKLGENLGSTMDLDNLLVGCENGAVYRLPCLKEIERAALPTEQYKIVCMDLLFNLFLNSEGVDKKFHQSLANLQKNFTCQRRDRLLRKSCLISGVAAAAVGVALLMLGVFMAINAVIFTGGGALLLAALLCMLAVTLRVQVKQQEKKIYNRSYFLPKKTQEIDVAFLEAEFMFDPEKSGLFADSIAVSPEDWQRIYLPHYAQVKTIYLMGEIAEEEAIRKKFPQASVKNCPSSSVSATLV